MLNSCGSDFQRVAGGLVGVKDLRNDEKNGGNQFEISEIHQIQHKSHRIRWDIVRFDWNLTGSSEILPEVVEISLDLEIFAGKYLVSQLVQDFWVLGEENRNRPTRVGF